MDHVAGVCSLLNGVLYALAVLRWGWSVTTIFYAALFSVLVMVAVIDTQHRRIPDRITFPAMAVGAAVVVGATCWTAPVDRLAAAAVAALVLWGGLGVAHLVSPRGLGRGDVKLGVVLGIAIGWEAASTAAAWRASFAALLLASLIGTALGLVLLVLKRRSEPYPFGPALSAGAIAIMLGSGSAMFG